MVQELDSQPDLPPGTQNDEITLHHRGKAYKYDWPPIRPNANPGGRQDLPS